MIMDIMNNINNILSQVKEITNTAKDAINPEQTQSKVQPSTKTSTPPPTPKHPLEIRQELEVAMYRAIAMIEGVDEIKVWANDSNNLNFKFRWHDTVIIGVDNQGVVSLRTGDNKKIGEFYRSINSGHPNIENIMGKKWSHYIMTKLISNLMTFDNPIYFPGRVIIDEWIMKSNRNKIILTNEKLINEEIVLMCYDSMGRISYDSTPEYAGLIEFINKNFTK
jgi:hypothetical protein